MNRARLAAATLAALTTGAAALLLTLSPAQAAATVGAGQPGAAQATAATPKLTVDQASDLPVDGARIAVHGTGFDASAGDVYIAVCADGSSGLTKCVGGAVPGDNDTSAWAHIGDEEPGTGGVPGTWDNGAFDVTLTLPSVTSGSPNCVTGKCAVYGATSDGKLVAGLVPVELTFKAPVSSSSSSAPASSSSSAPPTVPSAAIVQSISSPSIVAGGTQKVIFSGFKANEQVNLTLFSVPIVLSPVTADGTGVAQVEFVVPADLEAGAHRLEAIGNESKTAGVASFQVTAPVVSSSSPASSSPPPTSSSASSSSSSSSVVSSSAPASSAVTSSSAVAPTGGDSGNGLWWLWLIIGIVVVAGIITAIVVYRRKQQEQRERDEQEVTDAAAREQAASQPPAAVYGADAPTVFLPPVQPGGPPPGADPYGLLSGRDHPDNSSLYGGQDPAGPTEVLGPQGYQQGPGPYGQPLGYGGPERGFPAVPEQDGPLPPAVGQGGPPTEAMPPATDALPGAGGRVDGPGTQAWAPDLDDTDPDDGGAGPEDRGAN